MPGEKLVFDSLSGTLKLFCADIADRQSKVCIHSWPEATQSVDDPVDALRTVVTQIMPECLKSSHIWKRIDDIESIGGLIICNYYVLIFIAGFVYLVWNLI